MAKCKSVVAETVIGHSPRNPSKFKLIDNSKTAKRPWSRNSAHATGMRQRSHYVSGRRPHYSNFGPGATFGGPPNSAGAAGWVNERPVPSLGRRHSVHS